MLDCILYPKNKIILNYLDIFNKTAYLIGLLATTEKLPLIWRGSREGNFPSKPVEKLPRFDNTALIIKFCKSGKNVVVKISKLILCSNRQ